MATWAESKRQANLHRHGLDFEDCEEVFDHPVVTREDARRAYGEQRISLLGWLRDQVVQMTYTERGDDLHVISLREATNMKRGITSKSFPVSPEEVEAVIARAPKRVSDPECPYDPNDPEAVETFWKNATLRRPGQRGPGKKAKKVLLSMRYSPEVVEYFKSTGEGWQTRMDEALMEWVLSHRSSS